MYKVKEIFRSIQGEGFNTGKESVFIRFSGCNFWNGRVEDRLEAKCNFCDTDFIGVDGQNGGKFKSPEALVKHVLQFWPRSKEPAYIIFTGGEPALQLDQPLISCFKQHSTELAIETNGTLALPSGLDWICVSPKGNSKVVITHCNELKLVYPQQKAKPEHFEHIQAEHYFLSSKNAPNMKNILTANNHLQQCINYCLEHPKWKLCMQTHKLLNID